MPVGEDAPLRRFGEYELLTSLGSGGMGEVLVARPLSGVRPLVALKVLSVAASAEDHLVAMFMDEAAIMAQIHHPNVLEILDFGRVEDRYFIAMEYLRGYSLARMIVKTHEHGHPLDPALVAFVGAAAARGLHAAHTAVGRNGEWLRVVHRDVSPQNILVTHEGETKVIDFGIARADQRLSETVGGVLKGKAAYMSPEQIREEPPTGASDVFALGVCLWEALTGRRLFARATQFETMLAVTEAPIPPPSVFMARGDPALDAIILEALARDVHARPPNAASLEAALVDYQRLVCPGLTEVDVAGEVTDLFADEPKNEVLRELERTARAPSMRHRATSLAKGPLAREGEVPTFAGNPADLAAMDRLEHEPSSDLPRVDDVVRAAEPREPSAPGEGSVAPDPANAPEAALDPEEEALAAERIHRTIEALSRDLAPLRVRQAAEVGQARLGSLPPPEVTPRGGVAQEGAHEASEASSDHRAPSELPRARRRLAPALLVALGLLAALIATVLLVRS